MPDGTTIPEEQRGHEYSRICRQILEQEKPLKAVILEYSELGYADLRDIVSPPIFPNLVHVRATDRAISVSDVIWNTESPSQFRHIHAQWFGNVPSLLNSSTLTNLHLTFDIPNPSFASFIDKRVKLPGLVHLHIEYHNYDLSDEYDDPTWPLSLLEIVGEQLRTLFLSSSKGYLEHLLGEIWRVCPKIEDMYIDGNWPNEAPPTGHPIHTLGLNAHWIKTGRRPRNCVPDWPCLRTVRLDRSWYEWKRLGRMLSPNSHIRTSSTIKSQEGQLEESQLEELEEDEFEGEWEDESEEEREEDESENELEENEWDEEE